MRINNKKPSELKPYTLAGPTFCHRTATKLENQLYIGWSEQEVEFIGWGCDLQQSYVI